MRGYRKRGFTVVELALVIATIVILAVILISTLVFLLNKSHLSADERAVNGMNEVLENSETVPRDRDGVFSILHRAGFTTPALSAEDAHRFYWIAAKNVAVLVETAQDGAPKAILYPNEYANGNVSSYREEEDWYWLGQETPDLPPQVEKPCTHEYPLAYYPLAQLEGGSSYHMAVCSNCNEVMVEEEVHTFENGVCSRCGFERTVQKPAFTAEQLAESAVWVYKPESFGIANRGKTGAKIVYFDETPDQLYASIDEVFSTDSFSSESFTADGGKFQGTCIRLNHDVAVTPATYRHGIVSEECGRPVGVGFTLDLNGHELYSSGRSSCTVFYVNGEAEINIFDSSAAGTGKLKGHNPSVNIESAHVNTDYSYGLIYVGGGATLNLYSGTLETGRAMQGGGIHAYKSTVRMYGGKIANCSAYQGGGIYLSVSQLELLGGEIEGNKAYELGAGVCGYNNFNSKIAMSGGAIKNNATIGTNGCGGGICLWDGVGFTMTGGEISGNSAVNGGGLCFKGNSSGGTFSLAGGTVAGNSASGNGGAVYLSGNPGRIMFFSLGGGTFEGNAAALGGNAFYLSDATLKLSQGAPAIAETEIAKTGTGNVVLG